MLRLFFGASNTGRIARKLVLFFTVFLFVQPVYPQVDSLIQRYNQLTFGNYEGEAVGALDRLYHRDTIAYYQFEAYLLERFSQENNVRGLAILHNHYGFRRLSDGQYDNAETLFRQAVTYGKQIDDKRLVAENLSMVGNIAFFKGNSKLAISIWEQSITEAGSAVSPMQIASWRTNIGAAYLQMDYYQSSYRAFNDALAIFDTMVNKPENYYIAAINKAVACISLGLFDEAEVLLNRVDAPESLAHISFLLHMNRALLAVKQGDEKAFTSNADSAKALVPDFQQYEWALKEVLVEGYINFQAYKRAAPILREFSHALTTNGTNPAVMPGILLLDNWHALTGEPLLTAAEIAALLSNSNVISNPTNKLALSKMMARLAAADRNYAEAYAWYQKVDALQQVNKDSLLHNQYYDFAAALKNEELLRERDQLADNVLLTEVQLRASRTRLILLTVILGLTLLMLITGIYVWQRQKVFAVQKQALFKRERQLVIKEKQQLEKDLKSQQLKLQRSQVLLHTLRKTLQLLEPILNTIKSSHAEQHKEDVKALQYLYYEIETYYSTEEVASKLSATVDDFVERLSLEYPDLTANEAIVCSLVRLDYSSKDIASMLGKTEKSIENFRSRARNKLPLSNSDSLKTFLEKV